MKLKFIIGTRGSELALWQANFVASGLRELFPDRTFEIKIIKTTGDEQLDVALSKIGDKGLFTRQIETELLNGNIDLAVHSLKDLQTEQPDGLVIGAVCEREVPNDVFISKTVSSIADLPNGSPCGDRQPEATQPTAEFQARPEDRRNSRQRADAVE